MDYLQEQNQMLLSRFCACCSLFPGANRSTQLVVVTRSEQRPLSSLGAILLKVPPCTALSKAQAICVGFCPLGLSPPEKVTGTLSLACQAWGQQGAPVVPPTDLPVLPWCVAHVGLNPCSAPLRDGLIPSAQVGQLYRGFGSCHWALLLSAVGLQLCGQGMCVCAPGCMWHLCVSVVCLNVEVHICGAVLVGMHVGLHGHLHVSIYISASGCMRVHVWEFISVPVCICQCIWDVWVHTFGHL